MTGAPSEEDMSGERDMERGKKYPKGVTIPYASAHVDAHLKHFFMASWKCLVELEKRQSLIDKLTQLWTKPHNMNKVLPCLSVRSALDLYLQVRQYPPGSQVIMSAINIPDMSTILTHHRLQIVPWDIDIETLEPKISLLRKLRTEKTVFILVAHIYGKRFNMTGVLDFAEEWGIDVIEDCAECFSGLNYMGNPRSDLSLFSFGLIKSSTSFGGGIAKIRNADDYLAMKTLQGDYSIQNTYVYLKKVLKYFLVWFMLELHHVNYMSRVMFNLFRVDYKALVVSMMRGFPDQLLQRIREQPSSALLGMMIERQRNCDQEALKQTQEKGDYVSKRLPPEVIVVGAKAFVFHYWLYPILVENPTGCLKILTSMGVDAYQGTTQLRLVQGSHDQAIANHITANHVHTLKRTMSNSTNQGSSKSTDINIEDTSNLPHTDRVSRGTDRGPINTNALTRPDRAPCIPTSGPVSSPTLTHLSHFPAGFSSDLDGSHTCHEQNSIMFDISASGQFQEPSLYGNDIQRHLPSDISLHSQSCSRYHTRCPATPSNMESFTNVPLMKKLMRAARKMSEESNYPYESQLLIDHVIYLPVNKNVPYDQLDLLIHAVKTAVRLSKVQKAKL